MVVIIACRHCCCFWSSMKQKWDSTAVNAEKARKRLEREEGGRWEGANKGNLHDCEDLYCTAVGQQGAKYTWVSRGQSQSGKP